MLKLLTIFLTFNFLLFISPIPAYAADPPCDNAASIAAGRGPCPAGLQEVEDLVRNVISVVVGLGFIAMLILLIMAGFKYLTSGGEPKAIQSAHYTVTWALLGLLFIIIAWLILQLVKAFTGIDVTIFDIKTLCGITGDPLKFCR